MRLSALVLTVVGLAVGPALAEDLPRFPKAGPPAALPEALCDQTQASDGVWLLGRWVSPHSRWEFQRQGQTLVWSLERKGSVDDGMGWSAGTRIDGQVQAVSPCGFTLGAGDGQFVMEGVLTDGGKLYATAANAKGKTARFVLRRER